jgi:hypothetical protein
LRLQLEQSIVYVGANAIERGRHENVLHAIHSIIGRFYLIRLPFRYELVLGTNLFVNKTV